MTARRRRTPEATEAGESFADLVASSDHDDDLAGVRPLAGDAQRVTDQAQRQPRRRSPGAPTKFHHPQPEEPLLGHAEGIQASQFRRLRAGRFRPEVRVDLHGRRAEAARRHLVAELAAAAASGARCAIVIHGKGLRSAANPVLRTALPAWLASPALEGCVLAFAPAQPADGGRGATYVLLRRKRG